MRRLVTILACMALTACGTAVGTDTGLGTALSALRPTPPSARFKALEAVDAPVLQVGFVRRQEGGTVRLERQDGPYAYWLSPDGAHIILQDGLLHGTRGLGEGLLSAELSEPLRRIKTMQPGFADRFHTYLTGEDVAVTRTFRCRIERGEITDVVVSGGTLRTRQMLESCRSLDQSFDNIYWVDPTTGQIVQSRQWVGPYVGDISTRIVIRPGPARNRREET